MYQFPPQKPSKWLWLGPIIIIIIVVGYFSWKILTPNRPNPIPTPSPSTTSSPISTASWKPYTNSKYNFSIKIPQDYIVENNAANSDSSLCINKNTTHAANMLCQNASGVMVLVLDNPKNLALDAFATAAEKNAEDIRYKHEVVKINGQDALKSNIIFSCDGPRCGDENIYLAKDKQVVQIVFVPTDVPEADVYTQIAQTFQFTK